MSHLIHSQDKSHVSELYVGVKSQVLNTEMAVHVIFDQE